MSNIADHLKSVGVIAPRSVQNCIEESQHDAHISVTLAAGKVSGISLDHLCYWDLDLTYTDTDEDGNVRNGRLTLVYVGGVFDVRFGLDAALLGTALHERSKKIYIPGFDPNNPRFPLP